MMIDVQVLTLIEAVVLLVTNGVGALLTRLAWRVSEVDVREARDWEPPDADPAERVRRRHNRLLVTEDARHGEVRRFQAHILVATVGVFWLLAPQPVNPDVVWWAVAIRAVVILLSLLLIDKTAAHMISRYRFDKPWLGKSAWRHIAPALRLAWRDVQGGLLVRRT
jgi:hypothetical protein